MEIEVPEAQHVDVNDTPEQFQVGSWLVADFDGQYFVGQVRRAELNGEVLVSYLHQVVGRLNRYSWPCQKTLTKRHWRTFSCRWWRHRVQPGRETKAVANGCA